VIVSVLSATHDITLGGTKRHLPATHPILAFFELQSDPLTIVSVAGAGQYFSAAIDPRTDSSDLMPLEHVCQWTISPPYTALRSSPHS